jgi:hypothetical protein
MLMTDQKTTASAKSKRVPYGVKKDAVQQQVTPYKI